MGLFGGRREGYLMGGVSDGGGFLGAFLGGFWWQGEGGESLMPGRARLRSFSHCWSCSFLFFGLCSEHRHICKG